MLNRYTLLLLTGLMALQMKSTAQQIDFPEDRAVFQRSNQNLGIIPVRLSGLASLQTGKFRVLKADNSPLHEFDLSVVKNTLDTHLVSPGGWYDLELSGMKAGGQSFILCVKSGVGEVFLISGQSNAESEGPNATDDRVIGAYAAQNPKFISLTNSNSYNKWLYPSQPGTSFTGALGDSLVNYLDVPVLFLNAATGGMSSSDFYTSAVNDALPYAKLDWAIYQYLRTYGVRGVLWHQGESNSLSYAYRWTAEQYRDQINYVIDKTRRNLGYPDLSWMVALVSWTKQATTATSDPNAWAYREPTRNGQILLTNSGTHIYLGPDSDTIEGFIGSETRPDGVHLSYKGMALLGNLWFQKMKEGYLLDSEPFLPVRLKQNIIAIQPLGNHCEWQKIGVKTDSQIALQYKLIQGNALVSGDSLRLTGEGPLTLEFSHAGTGTYLPVSVDTVTFWPDLRYDEPQELPDCLYYYKNEPVVIHALCPSGDLRWYADNTLSTLLHSGDLFQVNPVGETSYFATCEKRGCHILAGKTLRLKEKDCISDHPLANLRRVKNLHAASPDRLVFRSEISQESEVTFTAKDYISLEPGSSVEAGSVFLAEIDGCTNSN